MSFFGFGPTERRILLAIGNLTALRTSTVSLLGEHYRLFDIGAAVAIPSCLSRF